MFAGNALDRPWSRPTKCSRGYSTVWRLYHQEGTVLSGDCIIKRVQHCMEIVSSRGYSTVWRLYHQEGTVLSGDCIINYLPSSIATFFYLGQTVQKVSFVYLFI